jgi:hypothetical protein
MSARLGSSGASLLRYIMVAGVLLAASLVAVELARYPANLNQGAIAVVYLLVLALLLVGYAVSAVRGTRTRASAGRPSVRDATLFGLLVATLWIIEIIAGNILDAQLLWVKIIYYGPIFCIPVLTLIAAAWAAARTGRATTGIKLGLWSGLVSGLIVALTILLLNFVPLSAQNISPGDLAAFHQSGLPDLATYEAGENLAATANHLWIGPLIGLIFGTLGGLVGSAISPLATRSSG